MHYLLNSVLYITIYIHIPQCIRSQSIYTSTNIPAIYTEGRQKNTGKKKTNEKKKKNRLLRFAAASVSQVEVKSKSSQVITVTTI